MRVDLYGGEVKLEFDAAKHAYQVTDGSKTFNVPSVTQALDMIDKSGPLAQWAANCAVDRLRESILPGVAYDEIALSGKFDDARFNFRRVSKKAIDIGSLAHDWVQRYLYSRAACGFEPVLPSDADAARCCEAARAWIGSHLGPVTAEGVEGKLYSRRYRYGGTFDCLAEVDGKLAVIDWKSSAAVYPEYELQLAAYSEAIEEMYGWRVDRWLARLGKTDGAVEAIKYPKTTQSSDFRAFLCALNLYRWRLSAKEKTQ